MPKNKSKPAQKANYLKQLRRKKRLSLRELEKLSGISNSYLSQLENGQIKTPSVKTLFALADFYKIPIEEFFKGFKENPPLPPQPKRKMKTEAQIKEALNEMYNRRKITFLDMVERHQPNGLKYDTDLIRKMESIDVTIQTLKWVLG